jgi:hypothetical protein
MMAQRREPNGRLQRPPRPETRKEIMATALAQPHRQGSESRLRGFALGRLFLSRQISADQFRAGERWTLVALRYKRDITGTLPRYPSPFIDRIARGVEGEFERDEDAIYETRRDWEDSQRALLDTNEHYAANAALTRVCILDQDPSQAQLGSLRAALNALERLWREPGRP